MISYHIIHYWFDDGMLQGVRNLFFDINNFSFGDCNFLKFVKGRVITSEYWSKSKYKLSLLLNFIMRFDFISNFN